MVPEPCPCPGLPPPHWLKERTPPLPHNANTPPWKAACICTSVSTPTPPALLTPFKDHSPRGIGNAFKDKELFKTNKQNKSNHSPQPETSHRTKSSLLPGDKAEHQSPSLLGTQGPFIARTHTSMHTHARVHIYTCPDCGFDPHCGGVQEAADP